MSSACSSLELEAARWDAQGDHHPTSGAVWQPGRLRVLAQGTQVCMQAKFACEPVVQAHTSSAAGQITPHALLLSLSQLMGGVCVPLVGLSSQPHAECVNCALAVTADACCAAAVSGAWHQQRRYPGAVCHRGEPLALVYELRTSWQQMAAYWSAQCEMDDALNCMLSACGAAELCSTEW